MLSADELGLLRPASIVCGFQHLAVAPRDVVSRLIRLDTTLISYELLRSGAGWRPCSFRSARWAGAWRCTCRHYLQVEAGGRGVLLGNVPGVPRPPC